MASLPQASFGEILSTAGNITGRQVMNGGCSAFLIALSCMMRCASTISGAVSYTHLDVYKRQDQDIMMANIEKMQKYADDQGVALRPHTKTHKAPYLAKLQRDAGWKRCV